MSQRPPRDGKGPRVADPEEYNQTQRLRAINEARQRVEDVIEQSIARQVTDADFSEEDRQQVIRATLYSYLTNIEWSVVDADETALLTDQNLGVVQLAPPDEFVQIADKRTRGYPRVIGSPTLEPEKYPIRGIHGYLTAPETFTGSWTIQIEHRHTRPQAIERSKSTYMPVHISLNAFRAANRFLNLAGMDIELEEDDGDAGFDYSDILTDGPPGGDGETPPVQADGGEPEEDGS